MRWEPIAEVTQIKGDSETHPTLSPDDPFADFERWDEFNISNTIRTTPDMYQGSYARSDLKRALEMERSDAVTVSCARTKGDSTTFEGIAAVA